MEKKTRKINFLINLSLPIVWFFVLVFCVFLLAFKSNAQGLPVDPTFNNSALTPEEVVIYLKSCDSQYGLDYLSSNYFIVQGDYRIFGRYNNILELSFFVFKIPDNYAFFSQSINDNNYSTFDWSDYPDGINCTWDCHRYALKLENNQWTPYGSAAATIPIKYGVSEVETNFLTYTPSVVCFSTNNIYVSSASTNKIINVDEVTPIYIGHATEPINNPDNFVNDLNGHKLTKPTFPTINNYTWTTYNNPPIDTSTIETLLESIFDSLIYNFSYLFDNLGGLIDNLTNNISDFVTYIGDSIYYVSNNIVGAIQDFATDFYNNMVSLLEPIFQSFEEVRQGFEEFADLFIHPFDEEEFEEQIENSSFFTNYNALIDNCEVITEIFDYAEEREHFSLYISFENPFADSEHKIISSEINFDWLVPLRSVYRPFIWVCVLVELFVGGARVLTRIIGGHGIG